MRKINLFIRLNYDMKDTELFRIKCSWFMMGAVYFASSISIARSNYLELLLINILGVLAILICDKC